MTDPIPEPLATAIARGDDVTIRTELLAHVADRRLSIGLPTRESKLTTLQLAATFAPPIADRLLRTIPLDGYSACALGRTPTLQAGALAEEHEGLTALGIAIVNGHVDTVASLLADGDDPNRRQARAAFFAWEDLLDPLDWWPIHLAAAHGYRDESATVIDRLIKSGADLSALCPLGETPLHLASTFGWLAIIGRLLDAGAPIDAPTGPTFERIAENASPTNDLATGATALHIAAREGRAGAIALLLERGANLHRIDDRGATALHAAAAPWWGENVDVVDLLLAAGSDPAPRDHAGLTPADYAQHTGFAATAERIGSA